MRGSLPTFRAAIQKDILDSEKREKKEKETCLPLYVSGKNHESYLYLGDGERACVMFKEAREEWLEADDDRTFYEFLEEIKDKR